MNDYISFDNHARIDEESDINIEFFKSFNCLVGPEFSGQLKFKNNSQNIKPIFLLCFDVKANHFIFKENKVTLKTEDKEITFPANAYLVFFKGSRIRFLEIAKGKPTVGTNIPLLALYNKEFIETKIIDEDAWYNNYNITTIQSNANVDCLVSKKSHIGKPLSVRKAFNTIISPTSPRILNNQEALPSDMYVTDQNGKTYSMGKLSGIINRSRNFSKKITLNKTSNQINVSKDTSNQSTEIIVTSPINENEQKKLEQQLNRQSISTSADHREALFMSKTEIDQNKVDAPIYVYRPSDEEGNPRGFYIAKDLKKVTEKDIIYIPSSHQNYEQYRQEVNHLPFENAVSLTYAMKWAEKNNGGPVTKNKRNYYSFKSSYRTINPDVEDKKLKPLGEHFRTFTTSNGTVVQSTIAFVNQYGKPVDYQMIKSKWGKNLIHKLKKTEGVYLIFNRDDARISIPTLKKNNRTNKNEIKFAVYKPSHLESIKGAFINGCHKTKAILN